MDKEFLSYEIVRNNAIKLAHRMYRNENFVPDVIYCSLRGGSYMANVISEYFKLALKKEKSILFAAVIAHSYTGVHEASTDIEIDGWTYDLSKLKKTDKILLVDDIFDSGRTINALVKVFVKAGFPRENIKVAVHDFKHFINQPEPEYVPDYYCRKFEINSPENDIWIHYLSHELLGLSSEELETYYYKNDPELKEILEPLIK